MPRSSKSTLARLYLLMFLLGTIHLRSTLATFLPPDYLVDRQTNSSDHSLVERTLQSRDIDRVRLDYLSDAYRGIYWESAYPSARSGDDEGGCTIDQFNILVEATRNGIILADFSGTALLQNDAAFNRFFVKDSVPPPGGKWSSYTAWQTVFRIIHHNLLQPSRYVKGGGGNGNRRKRVTYRCQDVVPPPPDTPGCSGGVPAYTVSGQFTGTGIATVLCPNFFASGRYLREIVQGPPKTLADFGSPSLLSYEQMLVHEWMHADIMGFPVHIDDLKSDLPSDPITRLMYGMSRCRDFAWKYMRDPECPHINPDTMRNADNYAWYFANKFFATIWQWRDDGSAWTDIGPTAAEGNSLDSPGALAMDPFSTTVPSIEGCSSSATDPADPFSLTIPQIPWPAGCLASTKTGDDFDFCDFEWPPPSAGICNCDENSCTDDSPACCANGSCPSEAPPPPPSPPPPPAACNCGESGCTPGSPACCANGSC